MSEKIKAIVIKSVEKKEKDVNILLFSLEKGKIWATLKGVKSPKAKMKTAQNPFTFGEFILEEGKLGQIVTSFESIENFHELSEDIDKYFEASAVLEVVNQMVFTSESELAKIFVLVLKTLKSICFGQVKKNYCLNKFLLELFKLCGFPLYSDKCTCCGNDAFDRLYINYGVGELVCVTCRSGVYEELSPATYMALKILSSTDFDKLSSVKLAQESEFALLKILVKNFENRFDSHLKFMGILS